MRFPERIRRVLERIVAEKRVAENVYGIGLFGSWSRGDAVASSDVDLLILDSGNFDYEYVERFEVGSLMIDYNHVPKRWLRGMFPPEIDQKLYEMQILYDRDWSLNNMKLLLSKSYGSPERVDIRTEAHVVESDIFLSRATSAFSREDFRSANLFVTTALEDILKILIEISLESFSYSRFLEKLECSAAKLGMPDMFGEYLQIAGLNEADSAGAKEKLRLFRIVWDEMKVTVRQNFTAFEYSHFRVKTRLSYYLNPAFLQGLVMRTNSLIDSGKSAEAFHYLNNVFLDFIEDYVWFKASVNDVKVDYTTLVRSLERLEEKNPKNYACMLEFLGLVDVDRSRLADLIGRVREIVLEIRRRRKVLIKNHLLKS